MCTPSYIFPANALSASGIGNGLNNPDGSAATCNVVCTNAVYIKFAFVAIALALFNLLV